LSNLPNEEEAITEQPEPLLVEEEEEVREWVVEEEQQHQIWPYQPISFYQQQHLVYEGEFNEWVRCCKEEQMLQFEEQQQRQYKCSPSWRATIM
jgi:hypothetical protein